MFAGLLGVTLMNDFIRGVKASEEEDIDQDLVEVEDESSGDQEEEKLPVTCDGYTTFQIEGNGFITKDKWMSFIEKNPFFVLGVSDSSCEKCCESERLLGPLWEQFQEKKLTYPKKDAKTKKIVRAEIPIIRIDTANKSDMESFKDIGIGFSFVPQVYIVKDGVVRQYTGPYDTLDRFFFQAQRMLNPVETLKTEQDIIEFLENEPKTWKTDYTGGLLRKDDGAWSGSIDDVIQEEGLPTRVVAFFYDKKEYSEEIRHLKNAAINNVNRINLRIGQVTDQHLIKKMKKKYP